MRSIKLKIVLPKVPNIELVAIEGLTRLAEYLGIPEEKIGEARILVAEAIINAFEHAGEKNNSVRVEYRMDHKRLTIFVRDYGSGFRPEKVDDPDIMKKMGDSHKRGWGLKLMKTMSDFFDIKSGPSGTKITIKKNLI